MAELNRVVAELVAAEEKKAVRLARGLVLGFTPQPCDGLPGAGARLVWSRVDSFPSVDENDIVEESVFKALKAQEDRVVVAGPSLRAYVVLRPGWGSTVMTWRWALSVDLFDLVGLERDRALEWIKGQGQ
jgi:hypothetical protein